MEDLRRRMVEMTEDVAVALLGNPTLRHANDWRWNRKGSLSVTVKGEKRGLWNSFEGAGGGDLFSLIMSTQTLDFPGAVRWARSFLRMPEHARPRPAAPVAPARTDETKRAIACRMWIHGEPISGTVAERYLVETRGIAMPQGRWPWTLRFHAQQRADVGGPGTRRENPGRSPHPSRRQRSEVSELARRHSRCRRSLVDWLL